MDRPAVLGEPDRLGAVAAADHQLVHCLDVRHQPPVGALVRGLGRRVAHALVRVRGHHVERALGAGAVGGGHVAVVVVTDAAEDDLGLAVAGLDRRVRGLEQAHVAAGRSLPELLVARLVPDLPGGDAPAEVSGCPAGEPCELPVPGRRHRAVATTVCPARRPDDREQDVHALCAREVDAAVRETDVPPADALASGRLQRRPAEVDPHRLHSGGAELRGHRSPVCVALAAPVAVELDAGRRARLQRVELPPLRCRAD